MVRIPGHFDRSPVDSETGLVTMRCRECGLEFELPHADALVLVGHTFTCPSPECALESIVSSDDEAEWGPSRKDPADSMAGVAHTDRANGAAPPNALPNETVIG